MKKILLSIAVVLLLACTGFGQITYNATAGTVTMTMTVDTTQAMTGCVGNNYNAEGQCEGGLETVYHTGTVAVGMTNKRTGKTASASMTKQGGVATATATLAVSPGDVVSYTETNQVYCPIANQDYGFVGNIGYFEIAVTMENQQGIEYPGLVTNGYYADPYCANGPIPDYVVSPVYEINAIHPHPWGWLLSTLCYSYTGGKPWTCGTPIGQYEFDTPQVRYAVCTNNP